MLKIHDNVYGIFSTLKLHIILSFLKNVYAYMVILPFIFFLDSNNTW